MVVGDGLKAAVCPDPPQVEQQKGVPQGYRTALLLCRRRREERLPCRALQPGEDEVGGGAADCKEKGKEVEDEQENGYQHRLTTVMRRSRFTLSAMAVALRIAPSRFLSALAHAGR